MRLLGSFFVDELPRKENGSLSFLLGAVPLPRPPPPDEIPPKRSLPLSLELPPNILSKGLLDGLFDAILSKGLLIELDGAPNGSVFSYGLVALLLRPGRPASSALELY